MFGFISYQVFTFLSVTLRFFTSRAKLWESAKVMGQIRLIPGISHPRRDTLKRRPTMPRQRQTPCYSSPYRGSKGRWRRVDECVGEWRAGQSSSVLPAPGAPSHISPGIYEPRYDREIARMAE